MRFVLLVLVTAVGIGCGKAEPPAVAVTPQIPAGEVSPNPPVESAVSVPEVAPLPRGVAEVPPAHLDLKAEALKKADGEVLKLWREGKSSKAATLLSSTVASTRNAKPESMSPGESLAAATILARYHFLLRQGTAPPDQIAVDLLRRLAERGGIDRSEFRRWESEIVLATRRAEAEGHRVAAFEKTFGTTEGARVEKLRDMDREILLLWREGKIADGDNLIADVLVGYQAAKPEVLSPAECKALVTIYARAFREPGGKDSEERVAKLASRGGIAESELTAWRAKLSAEATAAIESTKSSADAKNKAADKVKATFKKARELLAEAIKGEEEETKKAMRIVQEDDGRGDYETLKLCVEKDLDFGLDLGPGKGTVGQYMLKKGLTKKVLTLVAAVLKEDAAETMFGKVFADVNPDVTATALIDCVTEFFVADNGSKRFFVEWAKMDYEATFLADPGAKALAKKFRGR